MKINIRGRETGIVLASNAFVHNDYKISSHQEFFHIDQGLIQLSACGFCKDFGINKNVWRVSGRSRRIDPKYIGKAE